MIENILVFYTASARKDLRAIEKKYAQKIIITIKKYTAHEPLLKSKKLSGVFENLYRYRIGDYGAIFEYDMKNQICIMTILRIKHRKDIYK